MRRHNYPPKLNTQISLLARMPDTEENVVRRLLQAIGNNAEVSQRKLSVEIGIAVGSVNWYLRRCVSNGLIKLHQVPAKRYLYYLTPRGFEEKSILTARFLQSSFELYRRGRAECEEFFRGCKQRDNEIVFLAGDGDLAEIAVLSGLANGGPPLAVIDRGPDRKSCVGVVVTESVDSAVGIAGGRAPEAILLTDVRNPKATYQSIGVELATRGLPQNLIHVPSILNFRP